MRNRGQYEWQEAKPSLMPGTYVAGAIITMLLAVFLYGLILVTP